MMRSLPAARDILLIAALFAWILVGGWPTPGSADAARATGPTDRDDSSGTQVPRSVGARTGRDLHSPTHLAPGEGPLAPRVVLPNGPLLPRFDIL